MRAPRIVALLAVAGALGASACAAFSSDFSIGERADGGEPDALAATDGAVTADVVDGGGAVLDAGPDGVVTSDGGPVLGDAAEAGCAPIDASTYTCGENGGVSFTTPGQFCLEDYTSNMYLVPSTPSACRCSGQFTCACLKAQYAPPGGWCASTTADAGCFCNDGPGIGPVVFCGDGCNG